MHQTSLVQVTGCTYMGSTHLDDSTGVSILKNSWDLEKNISILRMARITDIDQYFWLFAFLQPVHRLQPKPIPWHCSTSPQNLTKVCLYYTVPIWVRYEHFKNGSHNWQRPIFPVVYNPTTSNWLYTSCSQDRSHSIIVRLPTILTKVYVYYMVVNWVRYEHFKNGSYNWQRPCDSVVLFPTIVMVVYLY
jgi:hypothetical protein